MNETRRALYELLSSDATLAGLATGGVFHQEAPLNTQFPLVIFQRQSGVPVRQFGAHIDNELWLVKGITASGSASDAEDIAARIDALLDGATLTITGKNALCCLRDSDVDYAEQNGAERFYHCGSLYRLYTEPA